MSLTTLVHPKSALRRPATKKARLRPKKPFKFELTVADLALDNAISAAAARSLAARRS